MCSVIKVRCLLAVLVSLVGAVSSMCSQASTLYGVNHTQFSINQFSVNGRSGVDIIGPYQGGGGGCCYAAPSHWKEGLTVRVDWETGVAYPKGFPGYADPEKYEAWARKIRAQKRLHSKVVSVPDYTGQKVCGLTVHFLPCDDIQVTTSCYAFGSREYPIKTALRLPVPQSCEK